MNNNIPGYVNENILNEIKARLNPDIKTIFLKLFLVHLFTAVITLSICSQFGFQTFKTQFNLMEVFMKMGSHFCDFACGIFFTATSFLLATFIIKRDELRVLRFHKFSAVLSVVLSSIGFFVIMNPSLFFELSLLWIIGAFLGATITLEVGTNFQLTKRFF